MTVSTKKTYIPPTPADFTPDAIKKMLRSNNFDRYIVHYIIKQLVLDWNEMRAYKLGMIDEKGKIIKKRSEMSGEERSQLALLDLFIVNIKKVFLKYYPYSIYSWAQAIRFIKENVDITEENLDEMVEETVRLVPMFEEAMTGGAPTVTTNAVGPAVKEPAVSKKAQSKWAKSGGKKKKPSRRILGKFGVKLGV